MSRGKYSPLLKEVRRLLFFYLFRDFDKRTIDAGFEFTTISPTEDSKVLCRATTINMKGVKRARFLVDASDRSIVNLPGRYICYWVDGKNDEEPIYNRIYRKENTGTYVHLSREARSQLTFDDQGLEREAENLVSSPRRYHEKFIRIFRF